MIIIPRRHYTQPQGRVTVDWSNPIAQKFSRLYVPQCEGFELVGPDEPAISYRQNLSKQIDPLGVAGAFNNSALVEANPPHENSFVGTLWAFCRPNTAGTSVQETLVSLHKNDAANPLFRIHITGSATPTGRWGAQYRNNAGLALNCWPSTGYVRQGEAQHVAATVTSANLASLYVDGLLHGTGTAPVDNVYRNELSIGAAHRGNTPELTFDGRIFIAGWGKQPHTADELVALYESPWQLFRADPIRIYSLPTGAISINSIAASNITQTGARITLGLTR